VKHFYFPDRSFIMLTENTALEIVATKIVTYYNTKIYSLL